MNEDKLMEFVSKSKVGTQDRAEKTQYLVCGPRSFYDDDIHGKCTLCLVPIVWRPHAPKKPKRICLDCLLIETKEGPVETFITPKTVEDLTS